MPLADGVLPTTTHPPRSTARAVVSPTPPGHDPVRSDLVICANRVWWPPGEISTIVVPVPWRLAALLKLLTSTSPRCSRPRLAWTTATPYGLTSPLAGTVEAMFLILLKCPMNDAGPCVAAEAGAIIARLMPAAAVAATTGATNRLITAMLAPHRDQMKDLDRREHSAASGTGGPSPRRFLG